ncbi:Acetyl-coenzyme A synthetase [Penicillium oxalicum]|uniref:Acetyl-coenzyme A synthetase n=1 Tax=Penicillium oxalicum TaxID=69781 RepID=UPI0020B88A1E|nr:Acetyl-coenzyme A synthetase [Penicillium oxalicum]KAI2786538.1 Acetyl-coenzyme A synthetase [Penicillium oxalicum]
MTIFRQIKRKDNPAPARSSNITIPETSVRQQPSVPPTHDQNDYKNLYRRSIDQPEDFWSSMATDHLQWDSPFRSVYLNGADASTHSWFAGGKLNACFNCVDRHASHNPHKMAILYERDEPTSTPEGMTFAELLRDVSKLSWVLKDLGVQQGEVVTVYMPNIPEAIVGMLACARIGAVHSVVFAGFSSQSLRGRLDDAKSKVILTVDEGVRGGKVIPMKNLVEDALVEYEGPRVKCLVLRRTKNPVPWCHRSTDFNWHEECAKWPSYFAPVSMGAEDPLYLLYTSGSTGKPKGLMHSTAGYLLSCAVSGKYALDLKPADVMFCAGDVGWITGHNYLVYSPLLLGITTVIFEGTPAYPDFDRFWQILSRCKASHFYAAPTTLRMIKKARPDGNKMALKDLRVIASIGEPLAPNVWEWCFEILGRKRACVLDTYFQTETGCHAFTPLAGVTPIKPGSVALPFFGFNPALIDPDSGKEVDEDEGQGLLVFKRSWPGIARTVWRDHARYIKTYFNDSRGYFITGDGASRDRDGYYTILGRVDDVVNISGHRLSTGEIESALLNQGPFAEVAVVGVQDQITGQALNVFAVLKRPGTEDSREMSTSAQEHVGKAIGRFAVPKNVFIVNDLPKTRSGKIMRRILRKILEGETDQFGDTSTLIHPDVISHIVEQVKGQNAPSSGTSRVIDTPGSTAGSASSITDYPYQFSDYELTLLDHILPPCHMFMFLSFGAASIEGIDALRHGVARLSDSLPFLTGVVVPSRHCQDKKDAFEVQPAEKAFLQKYPMLKVAFSPKMDQITPDDFIQQDYLPIPFMMPPTEPMPLVRFQANVTTRRIVLCVAYNHRALDSTGVSVVLKTLARLCSSPKDQAESLPTSDDIETSTRQRIRSSASKEPVPLGWTPVPLSLDAGATEDSSHEAVSRKFSLSARKIALLKEVCNSASTAEDHDGSGKRRHCTSNDVISALVGVCGNAARRDIVPDCVSPPRVIIAANVRKQCQLPPNYIGNVLVAAEATDPISLISSHMKIPDDLRSLRQEDLTQICGYALALRDQIASISESYLRGILHTISEASSFSSITPAYGKSIIVSSLRWMDFYLDFGPLGKVERYDIPETKVKGVCWVLPLHELEGGSESEPFELRFVLERAAMERLQKNEFFRWVTSD